MRRESSISGNGSSGTGAADRGRFDVVGQLPALRRYARVLTRDDAEAEDLVHDALLRAYERRGSFAPARGAGEGRANAGRTGGAAPGGGLRVWLMSILHNVFIDRRRSRVAEERRAGEAAQLAATQSAPAQEHHVRLAQIREAFMELPEEQRAALHLVAIEGLGYAEAASALGIPQGTLMSRLSRARATLRAIEEGGARITHLRLVGGSDDAAR
ncbi:sigma-70 family RNA polymerase sigma factor [Ancylobacter mangrovi]|uniref:sigma-70 family RNA polymerase sigma factor n=1 Tax=Ancylobacter mangrovi TaxID=2972472 RepID=UPI00216238B7|nr:sigma-70 family RNA polymerase sigma factor [Ancylobacter mangrovi]MCS0502276.1 sigma-70 family RNA polymerase sigma factor [Ancylobacter mangrovi]